MTTFNFWAWVILAILLGVGEILTGGFFMLPFACGGVVAAAVAAAGASLPWQLFGFGAATAAAFIVVRMYLVGHNAGPAQQIAGNRLINEIGVVVTEIDPNSGMGIVRVNRERWRADSENHVLIPEGSRIRVSAVVGTHLVVMPVADEPGETNQK